MRAGEIVVAAMDLETSSYSGVPVNVKTGTRGTVMRDTSTLAYYVRFDGTDAAITVGDYQVWTAQEMIEKLEHELQIARETIQEFARKSYKQVVSTREVHIPFEDWDAFRDFALRLCK